MICLTPFFPDTIAVLHHMKDELIGTPFPLTAVSFWVRVILWSYMIKNIIGASTGFFHYLYGMTMRSFSFIPHLTFFLLSETKFSTVSFLKSIIGIFLVIDRLDKIINVPKSPSSKVKLNFEGLCLMAYANNLLYLMRLFLSQNILIKIYCGMQ